MKKVYITGIAGLIGSNLAKRLLDFDYKVIGCDTLIGGYEDNIFKDPRLIWDKVDIKNTSKIKEHMEGCDLVIHTAAFPCEGLSVFSPAIIVDSIVSGTVSVASAAIANGVKRFIFCSSMARYGEGNPPFTEEMSLNPVDPYGLAKVQAEEQLKLLCDIHGMELIIIVPHNVIGRGQRYTDPYRNVASIMTNRILQNKPVIIYGDGSHKRSFSDVRDCVEAFINIIHSTQNLHKEVYNIGPDSNEITILELAMKVAKYCEKYPSFEYYPDRPREVKNAYCSSDKIKRDFNYNIMYNIDATINNLVQWIKSRGSLPFEYHLPIEIINEKTPKTWTEQKI